MGLALLYNSGASSMDGLVKGSGAGFSLVSTSSRGSESLSDSYETHMTLPGGNVAIITNVRLLLVEAQPFAALEADVEAGRVTQVSRVLAELGRGWTRHNMQYTFVCASALVQL